jgi:hypothetical protein
MSQSILTDKNQFPTDEIIFSHIGKKKVLWISLFEFIQKQYPEFNKEWRYYNDGKSWLLKVTQKAKTIFWLSVIRGTFRITFYFTDKAQKEIQNSSLPLELKDQFKTGKKYGKIRGVTLVFKNKKDCACAEEFIRIKLNIK